jgi:hypothetical protein
MFGAYGKTGVWRAVYSPERVSGFEQAVATRSASSLVESFRSTPGRGS